MTVHLIATGGTISSHLGSDGWTNLDGRALVDELRPSLEAAGVAVDVVDVAAGPSSNLTVEDMLAIAGRVRDALAAGAEGVVVTHGTDTMELTAFVTELVLGVDPSRRPVVFTGSMRVHSHPAPDGPANMLDAIRVAAHPAAVGREVLVCLDGVIHAAARVVKVDAGSVDAFTSAPLGPIGHLRDGEPVFTAGPPATAAAPAADFEPDVPLVTCYPGMPADVLEAALRGRRGAVVEVFGDLNVPVPLWLPIHEAWQAGVLVVLASRPFTATARAEGLDLLGAVGAGGLTAQKARLALMAALGGGATRSDAIDLLHRHRLERPPSRSELHLMTTPAPPDVALAATLQSVVEREHAIGGEPCLLRVEVPSLGLVSCHAAGRLCRAAAGDAATGANADGANADANPAATPDSPFRIASVTKPFTSVVVAQLVGEGRLSFDDRIADLLPASHHDLVPRLHVLDGVSYGERITMRQVLTHASGLFDYALSPSYVRALAADPDHVWTPREMLEGAIAWGTPHFPPGEGYGYAYADTGYVLAGVIIEHLDGRPLWQSFRQRILDPLGMTGTYLEGFEPHRGPALAHAYEGEYDVMPLHGSSDWAGGGLVSTVDELAVFAQALVDGRLLPAPLLDELLHWQFRTLDPALHSPGYLGYGMGVEAREIDGVLFRGHRGHWGVVMHVDPVSGITVTGTIDQAGRRPDDLARGAVEAIHRHLPADVWTAA